MPQLAQCFCGICAAEPRGGKALGTGGFPVAPEVVAPGVCAANERDPQRGQIRVFPEALVPHRSQNTLVPPTTAHVELVLL